MSYTIGFSASAKGAWRALPFELQEAVLDEVDRLANASTAMPRTSMQGDFVHDVVGESEGTRHYVFLVIDRDDARRHLEVLRLGHISRPAREKPLE